MTRRRSSRPGLTMRFGGVVAVDHVDFTLREGELRCLIGPNGAGKSTFFKCLTGQLRPTSGRVPVPRRATSTGSPRTRSPGSASASRPRCPRVRRAHGAENLWLAATEAAPGAHRRAAQPTRRWSGSASPRSPIASSASWRTASASWSSSAMVLAPEPDLILLDEPAAGMTDEEIDRLGRPDRRAQPATTPSSWSSTTCSSSAASPAPSRCSTRARC